MFECEPPSPSTAISLSRRVGGNSTAKIQYKRSQSDRPSLTGDPQQPVRRQPIPSPRTVETPVLRSEPSREFVGGGEQLAEEQLTEEQLAEEGLDGMSMEEMEALCEIMALEESQARAARMEALGYEVAGGEGREEYRKEGDGGEGGWWQVGYSDGPAGGEASGSGEAEGGRTEGGEGVAVVIGDDGEGDNKEGGSVGSLIRSIEGLPKQSKQQPPPLSPEKTPGKSRKSSGGKKSREKRRGEPGGAETVAGAIERFSGSGKDPVRVSTSRMTASTSEPSLALAAAVATAGNRRYGLANGGTASPMEDRPAGMAGGGAARGSAGLSGEFPLELSSSPSVSVVDAELSRKKTEVARYETELARRRAELNRLRVELASVSVEKVQADIALNRLKQEVEDWSYVPADGTGQGRNEADEAGEAGESGAPDVKKDGDGGSSEGNSSPGRLKAQLGKVRLENERLKRREKSLTADVEYIETMLAQEKGESAALRRELAEVKQHRKDLDKELSAAQKELSSLRRSAAVAERRAAAEEADAALLRQQLQKAQAAEMGLLEQLQLATKEAMGLRKTLVWSKETREDAEEWERGLQGTLAEQVQRNGELEVKGGEMMTRLLVLEKELAEEQQRRSAAEFQARDAVAAKELLEEEVMLLRHTRGAMKDAWAVGEGKEGGVDGGEGRRASSRAEEGAGDRNAKVASSDGLKMEVPARVWDILDQVEETKARGMAERDELTRLHWLTAYAAVRWLMRQANGSDDGIARRSLVGSRASAGCDYRRGSWVPTSSIRNYKPPYASGCAGGFSCDTNGRNPAGYVWVPAPPCSYDRWRFNPKTFLETMRNKIVAFVGDSLSDNLHASFHCILSAYTKIEFKKSWLGGAKPVGSLHAAQYNFTLLSINSGYIVQSPRYYKDQTQPYVVNPKWAGILRYTHSIIFSAGHWFFHPPSTKLGSNPDWKPMGAYRKAMGTLFDYFEKTPYSGLPIFMTFSPIHAGNACATANAPFANETDGVAHLNGYTIPAMKKQFLEMPTIQVQQPIAARTLGTDFEVHRNWLAITHSLPLSQWYVDATSPWTLDYPPLFALFERCLALLACRVDPLMTDLVNGLEHASYATVLFQIQSPSRLSPAASISDGHGLPAGRSSMALHARPALPGAPQPSAPGSSIPLLASLARIVTLGAVVLAVLLLSFAPFIVTKQIPNLLARLFPFGRGLMHAYWAPNFWALYTLADKLLAAAASIAGSAGGPGVEGKGGWTRGLVGDSVGFSVVPQVTPLAADTDGADRDGADKDGKECKGSEPHGTPTGEQRRWSMQAIAAALAHVFLSAFLLGWHVHEKAVLHFLLPLSLLASSSPAWASEFLILATVSHYALLPLLFTLPEFRVVHALGVLPLEMLCQLLYHHPRLHARLPFLPLLLTSVYCAVGIAVAWAVQLYAIVSSS
ncbi:unnamed protein product [Closterium sp. Yama58-4]|nr:unnamed protein product [Closterium sp. Yama58-4]